MTAAVAAVRRLLLVLLSFKYESSLYRYNIILSTKQLAPSSSSEHESTSIGDASQASAGLAVIHTDEGKKTA